MVEDQLVVPKDPRLQVYKEVWLVNDADTPYSEKISSKVYEIPAGGRIKLRRHEAVKVRGNFPGDGIIKKLRIIPIFPTSQDAGIKYVSQIDGKAFNSQEDLDKHLGSLKDRLKLTK